MRQSPWGGYLLACGVLVVGPAWASAADDLSGDRAGAFRVRPVAYLARATSASPSVPSRWPATPPPRPHDFSGGEGFTPSSDSAYGGSAEPNDMAFELEMLRLEVLRLEAEARRYEAAALHVKRLEDYETTTARLHAARQSLELQRTAAIRRAEVAAARRQLAFDQQEVARRAADVEVANDEIARLRAEQAAAEHRLTAACQQQLASYSAAWDNHLASDRRQRETERQACDERVVQAYRLLAQRQATTAANQQRMNRNLAFAHAEADVRGRIAARQLQQQRDSARVVYAAQVESQRVAQAAEQTARFDQQVAQVRHRVGEASRRRREQFNHENNLLLAAELAEIDDALARQWLALHGMENGESAHVKAERTPSASTGSSAFIHTLPFLLLIGLAVGAVRVRRAAGVDTLPSATG